MSNVGMTSNEGARRAGRGPVLGVTSRGAGEIGGRRRGAGPDAEALVGPAGEDSRAPVDERQRLTAARRLPVSEREPHACRPCLPGVEREPFRETLAHPNEIPEGLGERSDAGAGQRLTQLERESERVRLGWEQDERVLERFAAMPATHAVLDPEPDPRRLGDELHAEIGRRPRVALTASPEGVSPPALELEPGGSPAVGSGRRCDLRTPLGARNASPFGGSPVEARPEQDAVRTGRLAAGRPSLACR